MKLKEYESKPLLEGYIPFNPCTVVHDTKLIYPCVMKVQVQQNGRGKHGGVQIVHNEEQAHSFINKWQGNNFNGETVDVITWEPLVDIVDEWYIGIIFNRSVRSPQIIVSQDGGSDIESADNTTITVNILEPIEGQVDSLPNHLHDTVCKLYHCFVDHDLRMLEVNPLVNGVALDCVAVTDDDANYRRATTFSERTLNRKATAREISARKIDENDHRGVAGKTYMDLDGDIGIMTSGGGATMTLMDALEHYGLHPANYTEYSGNPPQEKVEALARIVLSIPNLKALLVAGVVANFTDIHATLQGLITVLKEVKPSYPIIIRRAGPNDGLAKKAIEKLKQECGLNITYYDETTSLTKVVEHLKEQL